MCWPSSTCLLYHTSTQGLWRANKHAHTLLCPSTAGNLQAFGRKKSIQKSIQKSIYTFHLLTDPTTTGPSMIQAILTNGGHGRSLEEWTVGMNQPSIWPPLSLWDEGNAKLKRLPCQWHEGNGMKNPGRAEPSQWSMPVLPPQTRRGGN